MVKRISYRIIAGLILLAAIAGIGFFAFRAGMDYRAAANVQVPSSASNGSVVQYQGIHHFMGIGLFGLLFVIFLITLAMGAMRCLIWGPGWGYRHMGHGPMMRRDLMNRYQCDESVPLIFTEWHKRSQAESEKEPETRQK